MRRGFLVVVMAVLMAISPMVAAAAGPGLNFGDDRAPNPYINEDTLTISSHDRTEMDSRLDFYNDNGSVEELPATTNGSLKHQVGVRFDKIEDDDYGLFPRVSGESGNSQTWRNATNWTTSTSDSTNVTPSLSDSDGSTASGVESVQFSTTGMGAGDTATASFGTGVDIQSDADKRVAFFVANFNDMSGDVEVRFLDSDGDYRYATANSTADDTKDHVIANSTGNGYVFQEKLTNLPMAGSGDGAMSAITSVEVVYADANADTTIVGLDVEKKSTVNLGKHATDENADGDLTDETASQYQDWTAGGVFKMTEIDSMGSWSDDAVLHDLEVYDVSYRAQDLTSADDYSVEFASADDYGGYSDKLEVYYRLSVRTAIDLTHGTMTLQDDQGLVGERYATAEIAESTGSTTFENVSDSSWSDKSSLYSSKGDTHDLDTSVTAGTNYIVHQMVLLQGDEVADLQSSGAMGGPTGQNGGGILGGLWNFITTPVGMIVSLAGGAFVAIRKLGGS